MVNGFETFCYVGLLKETGKPNDKTKIRLLKQPYTSNSLYQYTHFPLIFKAKQLCVNDD